MTTETKERKIPKVDFYQAKIDKVTYQKDVPPPPGKNWNITDKITLIFKLLGTKDDNDGEHEFSVFVFHNVTNNIHFERDGSKTLTKTGKMLQSIFGPLPYPLKKEDVDWEALVGCFAGVFIMHKPPNSKGEVYPEISSFTPPKDAEHGEFNKTRAEIVFKGKM